MPTSRATGFERGRGDSRAPDGTPPARPTVAIVVDDLSVRRALARLVRSFGCAVETYASGWEYLEANHPGGVSCLIADLCLEDEGGYEVYQRLEREGPPAPIVLIDACDGTHAEERARGAGASAYFRKPFDATALLAAVEAALGGGPSSTASTRSA